MALHVSAFLPVFMLRCVPLLLLLTGAAHAHGTGSSGGDLSSFYRADALRISDTQEAVLCSRVRLSFLDCLNGSLPLSSLISVLSLVAGLGVMLAASAFTPVP